MPPTQPTIKAIGFTEFFVDENGTEYKRRKGTQPWIQLSATSHPPQPSSPDFTSPEFFTLHLVRFNQYEGEPLHWSLVVSPTEWTDPEQPYVNSVENAFYRKTYIFEVRGDVEGMHHNFEKRASPVTMLEDVNSVYELVKFGVEGQTVVQNIAKDEVAPSARNRSEAKENCQGWCVQVVRKLVAREMVSQEKLDMIRDMMEGFDEFNQLEVPSVAGLS